MPQGQSDQQHNIELLEGKQVYYKPEEEEEEEQITF